MTSGQFTEKEARHEESMVRSHLRPARHCPTQQSVDSLRGDLVCAMNHERVAALLMELAGEIDPARKVPGPSSCDQKPVRRRRRPRELVRPTDEDAPEFIRALADLSLRQRGMR